MEIISAVPGRVRFKSCNIYFNKKLSKYINIYCDNLYGVKFSRVNPATATILVVYNSNKIEFDLLKHNLECALTSAAYNSDYYIKRYDTYYKTIQLKDKSRRNFSIFGVLYLILKAKQSIFGKFFLSTNMAVLEVASAATLIGGYPVLKRLYERFSKHVPTDSQILLRLTVVSFAILRESSKSIAVLVLNSLNDFIRYSSDVKCQSLMNKSMTASPGMAWIISADNVEVLTPVKVLSIHDIIIVHKGETISVNGVVSSGTAIINSIYYNGQPLITHIGKGSRVYEGLSVVAGELKIEVLGIPPDEDKGDINIKELVVSKKVKEFQSHMGPIALIAASAAFVVTGSMLTSLSVVLVLTPSGVSIALSSGIKNYFSLLHKHKIYLRNPNTMEKVVNVDTIAIDKTGTLTEGIMSIINVECYDKNYPKDELMRICAACEVDNYHPIAVSIQKDAVKGYHSEKVTGTALIESQGVDAIYDNKTVLIGNEKLMRDRSVNVDQYIDRYHAYEENLSTPIFISIDGKLTGLIVLKDIIRKDADKLIDKLKRRKITDINMLTGDKQNSAIATANILGIQKVQSQCSSKDKANIILSMKNSHTVMMVGDGINDTLAMKNADVSVSFANSSCDKVKMHSDCVIFEDDIVRLADFISLSQKSYNAIQINIAFSKAYNTLFSVLAFFEVFDAFAAKSLNTLNYLLILILNERIKYLSPQMCDEKKCETYALIPALPRSIENI